MWKYEITTLSSRGSAVYDVEIPNEYKRICYTFQIIGPG